MVGHQRHQPRRLTAVVDDPHRPDDRVATIGRSQTAYDFVHDTELGPPLHGDTVRDRMSQDSSAQFVRTSLGKAEALEKSRLRTTVRMIVIEQIARELSGVDDARFDVRNPDQRSHRSRDTEADVTTAVTGTTLGANRRAATTASVAQPVRFAVTDPEQVTARCLELSIPFLRGNRTLTDQQRVTDSHRMTRSFVGMALPVFRAHPVFPRRDQHHLGRERQVLDALAGGQLDRSIVRATADENLRTRVPNCAQPVQA